MQGADESAFAKNRRAEFFYKWSPQVVCDWLAW
jgi:hypothetical protein